MRLFVFDIDGTLIDYNQKILPSTINSINKLLENGDVIALASGRPFCGVKKYLDLFVEGKKYLICSNGANLFDNNGKQIYEEGVPYSLLLDIRNVFKDKLDLTSIFCLYNGQVASFEYKKWEDVEVKLNGADFIDLNLTHLDLDESLEKVIIGAEEDISKTLTVPEEFKKKYNVSRSSKYYIDLMNKNISKGYGVMRLSQILNIDKKDVFTFGDAMNDYEMIRDFNGFAMGNADPEVKKVAKMVTKSVTEDGISYALNNLINKE